MPLPTEDQDLLREVAREVLTEQAGPQRLRALLDTPTLHDPDLWKQISELGWPALALPEGEGGLGSGLPDLAVVVEECGRALMPSALTGSIALTWLFARHDTIPAPELIGAWSLGAADITASGPDLLLTGVRRHVPDAAVATHLLVDVTGPDGPALALVSASAPGLRATAESTIDLTRRYQELRFERVPAEEVLPAEPAATELFRCGVVLQCAESIGVAGRALDLTCEHVRRRTQFGRAIGSFQAVKHRIADMHIALEGARVATRDAAEAVQNGRSDAGYAVHVAKSWTGRAASAITSDAIQLHGGIGFTWEHDLHLLQRRAKANELLLGTPAWHDERLTRAIEAEG
ncbi:MAG TPA: acyl-CoA dehydrogenase [Pseudonocardiaceae bacterium]|jgi:alkylation response protein AidB-like acyl-CoA dehydrogenase|nr:acyl-CoA dehydrogenase [Pseudonocardiaceae bacterium]